MAARHLSAAFVCLLLWPAPARAQAPQDLLDRAEAAFADGRVAEALELFDALAAKVPDAAPVLWQRGIALYELGRYRECAAQFAAFHAVDPADLENATWHLLCSARAESLDRARSTALRAGPDPRILRAQVYDMARGGRAPESLVALANTSVTIAQFYAYLYGGLVREVAGDRAGAIEYLTQATSEFYREDGGFMNVVARVHLARLQSTPAR
jgi:tetratricopeptide (TPR) repeat protein